MSEDKAFAEFLKLAGPIGEFKPCAYYNEGLQEMKVQTKDCSYTSRQINPWLALFWENHRPWYAPWPKCVGFSLYCPSILKLSGTISVTNVLDFVAGEVSPHQPLGGKYRALIYRLAKGLNVQFPAQNS